MSCCYIFSPPALEGFACHIERVIASIFRLRGIERGTGFVATIHGNRIVPSSPGGKICIAWVGGAQAGIVAAVAGRRLLIANKKTPALRDHVRNAGGVNLLALLLTADRMPAI